VNAEGELRLLPPAELTEALADVFAESG